MATMKIFEPRDEEEARRGWLLHTRRRREIHELESRRLDGLRLTVGAVAAILAAVAGSAALAGWQSETKNTALGVVASAIGLIAAATAAAVSFLDFGGRAEAHRRTAAAYKDILRSFELWSAQRSNGHGQPVDLADLKAKLAEVDAAAPAVPKRLGAQIENRPFEWVPTADLLSSTPAPPAGQFEEATSTESV